MPPRPSPFAAFSIVRSRRGPLQVASRGGRIQGDAAPQVSPLQDVLRGVARSAYTLIQQSPSDPSDIANELCATYSPEFARRGFGSFTPVTARAIVATLRPPVERDGSDAIDLDALDTRPPNVAFAWRQLEYAIEFPNAQELRNALIELVEGLGVFAEGAPRHVVLNFANSSIKSIGVTPHLDVKIPTSIGTFEMNDPVGDADATLHNVRLVVSKTPHRSFALRAIRHPAHPGNRSTSGIEYIAALLDRPLRLRHAAIAVALTPTQTQLDEHDGSDHITYPVSFARIREPFDKALLGRALSLDGTWRLPRFVDATLDRSGQLPQLLLPNVSLYSERDVPGDRAARFAAIPLIAQQPERTSQTRQRTLRVVHNANGSVESSQSDRQSSRLTVNGHPVAKVRSPDDRSTLFTPTDFPLEPRGVGTTDVPSFGRVLNFPV